MLTWSTSSAEHLQRAEEKVLLGSKCKIDINSVEIFDNNHISTYKVCSAKPTNRPPLLLVHGFAAASGFWALNFEELSQEQDVYAIDLLGFGRSSRPKFPSNHEVVDDMFVESLEAWRVAVGLEKFVILGHSFGGYLSALYSLTYPERVAHLVLVDCWGFSERKELKKYVPHWKIVLFAALYDTFNPLALLRASGPFGPTLVDKYRPDIKGRYVDTFGEGDTRISEYLYHCNAQHPSGESAFMTIQSLGFAVRPLIHRIHELHESLPVTAIYGSESWIVRFFDFNCLYDLLPNSHVTIHVIKDASHHCYVDEVSHFNKLVNNACSNCAR